MSKPPIVNIIAAMSENRVIGKDGELPWRLPDEMKHFMRLTTGHTVVMGRRTFESIGRRPLPNRRNIVLTRNPDYTVPVGVEVAPGVAEAIELTASPNPQPPIPNPQPPDIFICGGEQAYRDALPLAERMYLTVVHGEFEGDAYFPEFDPADWNLTDQVRHDTDDRHAYAFTFRRYIRAANT